MIQFKQPRKLKKTQEISLDVKLIYINKLMKFQNTIIIDRYTGISLNTQTGILNYY